MPSSILSQGISGNTNFFSVGHCLRVSIAVKRHHDYNNSKGKHLIEGTCSSFRGSVHFHHGWKHGPGEVADVLASCREQEIV